MRHNFSQSTAFDRDDEEIQNQLIQHIRARARKGFIAVTCFALLIALLAIYRYYSTTDLVEAGHFYKDQLMSYQMLPFWEELGTEEEEREGGKIIKEGEHEINRVELGRMGWTILHMMTGAFPQTLTPTLVKKWNAFIVLFGHFYPCKLCSKHFLPLLKEVGQFEGTTKKELMMWLCDIHNRVNQRLGKPEHDCENVVDEWNTCGCSGDS